MQAITDNLVRNRYRNHKSRRVSRVKEQTNNSTSQASHTGSEVELETADPGAKASGHAHKHHESGVTDEPRSGGAEPRQPRGGDRTLREATEQSREKDPKSFTQNLFDTFAVRMLEWLPVPSLMNMPNFMLGGEDDRGPLTAQHTDETNPSPSKVEHSSKVEVRKLGNTNVFNSKLKPRSHSVTTRLRLNSASAPHHSSSLGPRKPSKQRELGSNDDVKQESQQQSQYETLRRQQATQAGMQSKIPIQAEKIDDIDFRAGILNAQYNTVSGVPESVKTWGQLKAWVAQNQEIVPASFRDRIELLQGLHYSNHTGAQLSGCMISKSGSSTPVDSDLNTTPVFVDPVEQKLDQEYRLVPTRKRNGYLQDGLIDAINPIMKPEQIKTLAGSHSSGSSSLSLPLDTPHHEKDTKTISAVLPNTGYPSLHQTKSLLKPPMGPSAGRPPQSLSHLSLDIAKALLDVVKPSDGIADDPGLFSKLSGSRSGQALKSSILRPRRRAVQFGAQSIFYVLSTPEALLQSFRSPSQDASESSDEDPPIYSNHPNQIDQAIRLLKIFDEPRIIFQSLWIALGALFTPPPGLSHPKSPRLKAAISISKTRSSWSSSEFGAVSSPVSNDYYSDRKAGHIMKLALSALVAAIPKASAETMFAVRNLRASGKVAPDANLLATNADLAKPLLEVTDVLEDELALRLMSRLVQALAARCCAAEIIKNKQMRNYSNDGPRKCPVDVLELLREYLIEAQCESSRSGAAHNPTVNFTEANATYAFASGWSMPAITVEWLRSVLLKEWDGRAEVARWGVVGGAVMILASLCMLQLCDIRAMEYLLT